MTTKKFFYGMLAAAFTLSLAGADLAAAQYGPCGRGQGGGRGACVQNDQYQTCPNYQGQGQGRRRGRQQRLRDGSCVNNPNTQSPTPAPAVPAPSSN
jgi:hypothetical protein